MHGISAGEADLDRECTDLPSILKELKDKSKNCSENEEKRQSKGSRRLTVVQGVSQNDPKSETGRDHGYKGYSIQL